MRRIPLVLGALTVTLAVAGLRAAAPPDFSGKWILASSGPASVGVLGPDCSIVQDATTLTIHTTGVHFDFTSRGPSVQIPYPVQTVYTLDGAEHPSHVVADPPIVPVRVWATTMTDTIEESIVKATWVSDQLVIMSYNKHRLTRPGVTPEVTILHQTVKEALSLDTDGSLVVDRLIVADPVPGASSSSMPTPVRSVYKKS